MLETHDTWRALVFLLLFMDFARLTSSCFGGPKQIPLEKIRIGVKCHFKLPTGHLQPSLRQERNGEFSRPNSNFRSNYIKSDNLRCLNRNKELVGLQYGVWKSYFATTPESIPPTTSLAIPMTCNGNRGFPDQLAEVVAYGNETADSVFIFDSVDNFIRHSRTSAFRRIESLEYKDSLMKKHYGKLLNSRVLLYKTTVTSAVFRVNITFDPNILDAYRRLRSPYIEHQRSYYNFFSNYGSHYLEEATYGGACVIAVWYNASDHGDDKDMIVNEYTRPDEVDNILSGNRKQLSRYMEFYGGDINPDESFRSWKASVMLNPALIDGSLKSFSKMEVDHQSKRTLAFTDAVENEEAYCDLMRATKKLPYVVLDRRMKDFISKAFNDGKQYIAVTTQLKLLSQLINHANSTLSPSTIEFKVEVETSELREWIYFEAPAFRFVCTSVSPPSGKSNFVGFVEDINSIVRFFYSSDCSGRFIEKLVSTILKHEENFFEFNSFQLM